MEFLTRLKDLRRQSGLSQEQLANRIGVSRQAISKWESGTGRPEIEKLVALADVFAVSVDALLGGVPPRQMETPANTATKASPTTILVKPSISISTVDRSTHA